MKHMFGILFVFALFAAPAHALSFHPALELEGGTSIVMRSGAGASEAEMHWRPEYGFGVSVGADPMARVSVRTGLLYRYSGSRMTPTDPYLSGFNYRSTDRWSTLRVPVRVAWSPSPEGHWLVEGALVGRYLLKATQDIETDAYPFIRRPLNSEAIIFESLTGERDVTEFVRRGDVAVGAGLGWRGRLSGRVTTLTLRMEQGIYDVELGSTNSDAREQTFSLGAGIAW
ncbi:MAG: hypothetical protein IT348_16680 [Candidatus Eisenbacteria bacterium]|nr:hypothetical protein [Candidatus Eisenbacteria bacterium]